MKLHNIWSKLKEHKLVVVLRSDSMEEAVSIADACIQGGIKSIEVTFTIPNADLVIEYLNRYEDVIVGAGSILDSESARLAIIRGADFIVGPNFSEDVALLCNRYQLPYIPGCISSNEILQALESGSSMVKIFPSNVVGVSGMKNLKGPIPQVEFMPTGGVTLDNIEEWLLAGALMVGVGGEITRPAKQGDYKDITINAQRFVDKVRGVSK